MSFSRQEQLDSAVAELERHAKFGELIREAARLHFEQASHLLGLYEEVEKLVKGKSLVPVSDLQVDLVNSIISDAKRLIYRDTYLDRSKEFVPAGNNPAYSDLLLALRVVQQGLGRFGKLLEAESNKHLSIGVDLTTVVAALKVAQLNAEAGEDAVDDSDDEDEADGEFDSESEGESDDEDGDEVDGDREDDESESQEEGEYAWRSEVRRELHGGKVSDRWFKSQRYGEDDEPFNFAMLDRLGIPRYEPPSAGISYVKADK